MDDLTEDVRDDIVNSKSSYTIPSDIAFKDLSVLTPACWVFNADARTSTGYSLNDILAKGTMNLMLLINMVLSLRMSAFGLWGDIQQI